ncbi:negative elongation factor A, putative [Hepatocystis sp. ex Piliocolobus tephrosceles]|nr:negative elongation factor A, putative [Hepatocystis sp. ex Piliocolobus tephrosceles]
MKESDNFNYIDENKNNDTNINYMSSNEKLVGSSFIHGNSVNQYEHKDSSDPVKKKKGFTNDQENNEISDKYIKYLECIKNNWSSSQASKLLNEKLIKYISERFLYMSSSLKVRVLTSFLYLNDNLRIDCEKYLLLITANGEIDGNGWVKRFSRILKPFIKTGVIDIKDIDSQTMHRILNYIDQGNSKKNGKESYIHDKTNLEYIHMCDPINELEKLQNKNIIHLDEYKLFTPSKDFDCLLSSFIKKGITEFKS